MKAWWKWSTPHRGLDHKFSNLTTNLVRCLNTKCKCSVYGKIFEPVFVSLQWIFMPSMHPLHSTLCFIPNVQIVKLSAVFLRINIQCKIHSSMLQPKLCWWCYPSSQHVCHCTVTWHFHCTIFNIFLQDIKVKWCKKCHLSCLCQKPQF